MASATRWEISAGNHGFGKCPSVVTNTTVGSEKERMRSGHFPNSSLISLVSALTLEMARMGREGWESGTVLLKVLTGPPAGNSLAANSLLPFDQGRGTCPVTPATRGAVRPWSIQLPRPISYHFNCTKGLAQGQSSESRCRSASGTMDGNGMVLWYRGGRSSGTPGNGRAELDARKHRH